MEVMGKVSEVLPVNEITINVPWGQIAAKTWGYETAPPVLCVHGIQDNANTFDTLIPLLPSSFYYVAVDLPGHGRSSHFPPGNLISMLDYTMTIERIVNHFGWKNIYYMGHSLGGQIGFIYSSLHAEKVVKLVVLDAFVPHFKSVSDIAHYLISKNEKLYILENNLATKSPPEYSLEEATQRLTDGRPSYLSREAAELLRDRGVVKQSNGYSFAADQRLKLSVRLPMTKEQVLELLSKLQCPLLVLRATESVEASRLGYVPSFDDFDKLFRISLGENYSLQVVEGTHDVHLLHPEREAQEISKFFVSTKSRL